MASNAENVFIWWLHHDAACNLQVLDMEDRVIWFHYSKRVYQLRLPQPPPSNVFVTDQKIFSYLTSLHATASISTISRPIIRMRRHTRLHPSGYLKQVCKPISYWFTYLVTSGLGNGVSLVRFQALTAISTDLSISAPHDICVKIFFP